MAYTDGFQACLDNRHSLDLLRPHWVELNDRLWADHITGKLFEKEIISDRHKEQIERKAGVSRREGVALLLDVMMTRSWSSCVQFAVILSETEGVRDLGEKLVRDAGGGDVRDEEERKTIVQKSRRMVEDKNKLMRENQSLKKETKSLILKVKQLEKRGIGERLLRVGLEMVKGSVVNPYKWKQYEGIPDGDYSNCVATSQHKVIAAGWSSNMISMIDVHSSYVTFSTVDNTHNPCGDKVESLFNAGDKCFGTFYNTRKQQRMGIYREETKKWHRVTDIASRDQMQWYGIAGDRHRVYIVGGRNDDWNVHNTILVYDINTGTQCDSKTMSGKICGCSCTIIDNMLYVGGGWDGVRGLNSIQCISLRDYSSHYTMPATPTYDCSLTSLGDRLVIIGGMGDGLCSHPSNMVSVFSPSLNSWLPLPAMNEARYFHGACTVSDDALVVVGGMKCINKKFVDVSCCEILQFE